MTNLNRMKLEINNKQYFSDAEYEIFLSENNLIPSMEYNKATDQANLLYSVVDTLEALANDVDLMRKVDSDFANVSEASKWLYKRIEDVRNRIANLPTMKKSQFTMLYKRG